MINKQSLYPSPTGHLAWFFKPALPESLHYPLTIIKILLFLYKFEASTNT